VRTILNISAYRFVTLSDTARLRESIRSQAQACDLKGTVLLAGEGINLFLAGAPSRVRAFLAWLRGDPRFADLRAKESLSDAVPFRKLLVKIKREIIRMDHPAVRPEAGRAPAVDPLTLRRWLAEGRDDAGRPVVMLDTRNAFEVDRGRFRGALDWHLTKFSDFPAALHRNREQFGGKTVVSYCTGGIRCEKAAIVMREAGIEHAWQLDGGILGWFEHAGGAHFDGDCFVFDAREALGTGLEPATAM
jgi:UPF0176 protein